MNLRLLAHAEANLDENAGPFIKGWLKDIGINITLQPVSDTQVNEDTTRGEFDLAFSGWNANPDPDYVLSLQTCANRPNAEGKGGTPDSFLCDKDLRRPVQEAAVGVRPRQADRSGQADAGAALRPGHDRHPRLRQRARGVQQGQAFEGFPLQPADGGVIMNQQGYWGYFGATPAGEGPVPVFGENGENTASGDGTTDAAAEDSGNTGLILLIVGVVVVVLLVGGLLVMRGRRKTADDRE